MATYSKDLVVKFISLPAGNHDFNFHIGDEFFEQYSNSIIHKANLEVKVVLNKTTTMEIDIEINGDVDVECVRCLEHFTMPIHAFQHLLIRMVDNPEAEDDDNDTIHIANSASELVLNNHIYDFVTLEIPYSPTHPDEDDQPGCVNEALDALSDDQEEEKSEEVNDERWSALKKIKLN